MGNILSNQDEKLFRAAREEFWNDNGTLKSSAFKGAGRLAVGVSVDREAGREYSECLKVLFGDRKSVV